MTTNDNAAGENLERLNENLAQVERLSQRLVEVMGRHKPLRKDLNAPNQEVFANAATAYWTEMMNNPGKVLEQQLDFWAKSVKHFVDAQHLIAQGRIEAPEDPTPQDRRFKNPLWQSNPYFNFIKQQYLLNSKAIADAVDGLEGLDDLEKHRIEYFSQQIIDMMSPTNFLGTNPDALEKAVETEGLSLIKGLENMIADLESNNGELIVTLADENAFEIGRNIATTPGKVVFRNHMFELLQYSPTTETVHEVPLIIFPPWINKYYILDLKEQNSMIKWAVDQGYTVFIVSWINPDRSYANIGMEEYINDGFMVAFDEVKKLTKQKQVNAVGYCIAGTTLHLTLSLMKKRKDKSVKSATFFTCLTDFADQGEFTPFLQNDFIDGIDDEINEEGILRSFIMQRTFSFLRSNDLIYGPAIKSYMMGEAPPAFDLLYWNGDGSGLPGKMAHQYLRRLCQDNQFVNEGVELCGETLHISDVDVPVISITCETDHIARWKDCYRGFQQTKSKNKTFVVSESGHIAGIVNPPSKKKYGHYTNSDLTVDSDTWMKGADYNEGSWWPLWDTWLSSRSGKQIAAREPGDSEHPVLCDAPGTYVAVKATR
ncbi:class I poly(R)-hydroxyalkanoic acid synthase [Shimia thalassica]|uniref:class I poly(R)-hydroxyalkanoic acid synthase n=1 Tax=Shimia thalassica TaxID=1715693 RepID=UPI001C09C478|nr:class I poly(R)-hydroxyalkanoic acid synthase [Shimia thalassica]MBU2943960.1 class I poly(R)-hydroxyalkanoic acid synthase [Shimia thalassica]MDO6480385.1 class I poly(R)-hydroxyalkanoic acid synthase [Shimia thalassica]MDO6503471.1 class I poly(R)-hydroxyalkanoic acid synthase [Shimia thalassica]MDO6521122.1 class I poly(R)-hydroxyalkanoic acid synthase [Shimia thalassica]MDO6798623.1 class I poly(R)-hydroxyalkanoic acid synthase [Shimia thalassica]